MPVHAPRHEPASHLVSSQDFPLTQVLLPLISFELMRYAQLPVLRLQW